jgi:hypothetical protein
MFLEIIFRTNSFSLAVNSGAGASGGIRFSTNLTRKKKKIKEKEIPTIVERETRISPTDR